ncbi:unnamed protein product [Auanema sp. JU1783]|nr:unnamed protein product [Auanema sp. JU1783]
MSIRPRSSTFMDFIAKCLRKDPEERASTDSCIQVVLGRTHDPDDIDDISSNVDSLSVDRTGRSTSSKTVSVKSLTSFQSLQSRSGPGGNRRPPIPGSMRQDSHDNENKMTIPIGDISLESSPLPVVEERNNKDDMMTLRNSQFSTLRSAKFISREQEECTKENNMCEEMSGYKRLRQTHHKELQQVSICAIRLLFTQCFTSKKNAPQVLLNGFRLDQTGIKGDKFEETVMLEVMKITPKIQRAVRKGQLTDRVNVGNWLVDQKDVMPRLNKRVLDAPSTENYLDLTEVSPCKAKTLVQFNTLTSNEKS